MISRLVNKGAIMCTAFLRSVQSDESQQGTFYLGVEGSFPHFYYPTFLRITRKNSLRGEKGVIFGGEFAPVDGANGVHLLPLLPAALPEGILAKKKR